MQVRQDYGGNLFLGAGDVRRADAVARVGDGDYPRVRRQADLEDVVHAHEALGEVLVYLDDDLVRVPDRRVGAARGGGEVQSVLADRGALNEGDVQGLARVLVHVHGEVRDVHVAVLHLSPVYGVAQVGIGLVRIAPLHQSGPDHRPVDLVAHGGPDADGQVPGVARFHQRIRHRLRVTHACKSADAYRHAAVDEHGGFLGGHYLVTH